jgi:hypothetical protein
VGSKVSVIMKEKNQIFMEFIEIELKKSLRVTAFRPMLLEKERLFSWYVNTGTKISSYMRLKFKGYLKLRGGLYPFHYTTLAILIWIMDKIKDGAIEDHGIIEIREFLKADGKLDHWYRTVNQFELYRIFLRQELSAHKNKQTSPLSFIELKGIIKEFQSFFQSNYKNFSFSALNDQDDISYISHKRAWYLHYQNKLKEQFHRLRPKGPRSDRKLMSAIQTQGFLESLVEQTQMKFEAFHKQHD